MAKLRCKIKPIEDFFKFFILSLKVLSYRRCDPSSGPPKTTLRGCDKKGDGKKAMAKKRWQKGDGKKAMAKRRWQKGDGKMTVQD